MSNRNKLIQKMVKVMASAKRVEKNGRNDFHKYDYITESDVMDLIRPLLIQNGLFITSSVVGSQKEGEFVSVSMKHTVHDEDTGESLEINSLGIGQDKGDKAANKAVTAAVKYFLLKNFMLGSGDDPEATDETGKATGSTKTVAKDDSAKPAKAKYGFAAKPKLAAAPTVEASDDF